MTASNLIFTAKYGSKVYTSAVKTRVSNALLVGEIIGQIGIGLTCDWMGRKAAIILTTLMLVVGGILGTAAHGTTTQGMFWMLTVARGIVGVGSGGEYPASSVSASEASNQQVKRRGATFVMVTNFPLSFGGPFCLIIFLIVWSAAGGEAHLSTIWRVCFGIGCIWPLSVFYFRLRMTTSELYKKGAMKKKVPYLLVLKYYWPRLIGTCGAWFFYDFVTFPNGIFSGTIIANVTESTDIKRTIEWTLLLGIIALPGVFVGAYLCEKIGRKYTAMIGFAGYLVFGLVIGCAFEKISKITALFIVFYGLMNSFGNLGPGDMMGLVSSESYATGVRGTCYGLSAAVGKAGAAIGTEVFTPIQTNLGQKWTFIIAAIIGLCGIVIVYFFIPHLNDEDLGAEDRRFAAYLRSQGWDGQIGEDDSVIEQEIAVGDGHDTK
ncbi:Git1p [Sugiyamaella lignohabitans]|uniref:Git1p n=1 Tax=Sugiyamaella lignohabitans TaxID=796027 RepID=A0A167FMN6_9ASCO|nr:Git1p [Sugiyamaella lignohabitans]ANB15485.1 Git1p [Sugiyamaella lignohabitans]